MGQKQPSRRADIHIAPAPTLEELREELTSRVPALSRLGTNLEQAIRSFLDAEDIPVLGITWRLKSLDSLFEKISRKGYSDPFSECDDLCGVRVICYYPSDVLRIGEIIENEFDVVETLDKSSQLGVLEFGYRSQHYIVRVKKRWLAAPNFRGLQGLKAEIQVRTILMHAWAEIQHKLAYKSEAEIPNAFRRKFSRLSAKFEEADEQFEELRAGLVNYRRNLEKQAESLGMFDKSLELNLDSLEALLAYYFPSRRAGSAHGIQGLLSELRSLDITMPELVEWCERGTPFVDDYEIAMKQIRPKTDWNRVGALRGVLHIASPKHRHNTLVLERQDVLETIWKLM